ncbi:MAG: UDP-N-acetylmuramoyl-L-alanine--D-glutamate ligase [Planctomycetota bacterium]
MEPLPYAFPSDEELRGRRVVVLGLGLFGGGEATVRFLCALGCSVLVTDLREESRLAGTLGRLSDLRFDATLGRHSAGDLASAEWLVVNPAVPPHAPFLQAAVEAGVPLTSEVGLTLSRLNADLVLVTGSKGKSTTSTLIHEMLLASGRQSWLCGNIGRSILREASDIPAGDAVVFEISSFQLEQLAGHALRPKVAVLTNLFPVHLDRHGTFEEYCRVKESALSGAECAILNHSDPTVRSLGERLTGDVSWFSGGEPPPSGLVLLGSAISRVSGERVVSAGEITLPGRHNLLNVMAALLAAEEVGCNGSAAVGAARSFAGVPHRLELVGRSNGTRLINDSIATVPQSTLAALAAFEAPLILIAGGYETGCDLRELAAEIGRRARLLVTLGQSGPRLASAVAAAAPGLPQCAVESLEDAVATALAEAGPEDVILLSPAFPSYDMFQNFQERGDRFRGLAPGR